MRVDVPPVDGPREHRVKTLVRDRRGVVLEILFELVEDEQDRAPKHSPTLQQEIVKRQVSSYGHRPTPALLKGAEHGILQRRHDSSLGPVTDNDDRYTRRLTEPWYHTRQQDR